MKIIISWKKCDLAWSIFCEKHHKARLLLRGLLDVIKIQAEREALLAHPLVTSLLQHKWNTFGSFFYYLSFAVYLVFLCFLTGYMVVTDPPNTYGKNGSKIENNECSGLDYEQNSFASIATYVIIALAGFNLLKE
ncbi:transient receptor potential cation channel subfamily A member 1-like protein, partial [Elysia marginata]